MTAIDDPQMTARRLAKIHRALTVQKKSPTPQLDYSLVELYHFTMREMIELKHATITYSNLRRRKTNKQEKRIEFMKESALFEIADVLNCLEYLYKAIMGDMTPYQTVLGNIGNGSKDNSSVTSVNSEDQSRKISTDQRGSFASKTTDIKH